MTSLARAFLMTLLAIAVSVAAFAQNTPPKVELKLGTSPVKRGEAIKGKLVVTFGPGLHAYQNPPKEDWQIPVSIAADSKEIKLAKPTYPKGVEAAVGGLPTPALVYEGVVEIPITFSVSAKDGPFVAKFKLDYQQCDAKTCYQPGTIALTAKLTVQGELKKNEVETGGVTPTSVAPTSSESGGLAGLISQSFASKNYALLFALLFVVGLAINLTPCVYPMIPITIGFFSGQAKDSRGGRMALAAAYTLGIALMYGVVGGVAAGAGAAFGVLFTQPWFLIALALLMFALALSMFDVYQIGIPPVLARQIKGRSGWVGALIMGLLVGVAAAPCAGPLIVAIFTEVAKLRSIPMGVLIFSTVGLGLGVPYLILGALSTGSAKALPKSGGWMKAIKAILGFVVIGVGLGYLVKAFPIVAKNHLELPIWIAFYLIAAAYLLFIDRSGDNRPVWLVKGTAILAFGAIAGMGYNQYSSPKEEIDWQPFTEESWALAKKSGKPIVIDGTANWCAECRTIEANVFSKPEAVDAAKEAITLRIDWSTGVDENYISYTKQLFDIQGLPHIVLARPGGEIQKVFNELSSPEEFSSSIYEAAGKRRGK